MDSLLIHVLLNKRTPRAQEDVQLLKTTLEHFKRTEPQYEGKMASDAMTIMYKVAKEAVAQPHGLLQE